MISLWRFIIGRRRGARHPERQPAVSELRQLPDDETPEYLRDVAPLEHELALLAEQSEWRTLTTAEQRRVARGIRRACRRVLAARARRDGKHGQH